MTKLMKLLTGAGAALVLSACGQAQNTANQAPPAPPVDQAAQAAKAQLAQEKTNEMTVESFFKPGITMDERLALMSPGYIQHNPVFVRFGELNNVQGRDAFKLMLETLSKLRGGGAPFGPPPAGAAPKGPQPPQANFLYKVMADGDTVTVIHQRYLPDPQNKGKFYEVYGFDTFRMEDGKIAEHWDDATIPEKLPIFLREPVSTIKFPKQTQPVY